MNKVSWLMAVLCLIMLITSVMADYKHISRLEHEIAVLQELARIE